MYVNPRYRQQYHFMAEAGWINDPNGFCHEMILTIFFINTIHTAPNGAQCTGDMRPAKT